MNRVKLIRLLIITTGILVILAIAYFFIIGPLFGGRFDTLGSSAGDEEVVELTEYQTIAQSSYEQLLVLGINEQSALDTPELYITDFASDTTASMNEKIAAIYSNYLPESGKWFTLQDNNLYQHTVNSEEVLAQVPFPILRNPNEVRNGIAASPDGSQLAWVTRQESHHEVVLFDVANVTAQLIYGREENDNFHSISWSPNGQELAMINGDQEIVIIDRNGVQNYNPISQPFSELSYLEWIEDDTLAVVMTSRVDNPEPFEPSIVLFNQRGEIIEEHPIISNVGVPRVMWADDGLRYTYYNPWKNQFMVYNRFDELEHVVDVQASGSFAPFGWTTGTTPTQLTSQQQSEFNLDFDTLFTNPDENTFTVSGDEWEGLNLIHLDLVEQFKAKPASYRFNATNEGIALSFALKDNQKRPEQAFIQIALQSLFILDDVPAISLTVTMPDGTLLKRDGFTREDAERLTDEYTSVSFDKLFVITPEEPLGKPAHKTDVPEYTYLGDILYSSTGEFNAYPALSFMGTNVTVGDNEPERLLWRDSFSVAFPNTWLERNLGEAASDTFATGDTLFYSDATEFRSNSAWEGFGVSIRQYEVPAELTIEQWAEVNRRDSALEDIVLPGDASLRSPLVGKHVVTISEFENEYVLKAGNTVYAISYTNNQPITEAEQFALLRMVETFSDHSVFQRGDN